MWTPRPLRHGYEYGLGRGRHLDRKLTPAAGGRWKATTQKFVVLGRESAPEYDLRRHISIRLRHAHLARRAPQNVVSSSISTKLFWMPTGARATERASRPAEDRVAMLRPRTEGEAPLRDRTAPPPAPPNATG